MARFCVGTGLPHQRRGLLQPWSLSATATTNGMESDRSVAAQVPAYQGLQRLYKRGAPPSYVGSERRDGDLASSDDASARRTTLRVTPSSLAMA